ncbi:Serine/threonine protein kinase [Labilithrix luteola]|uniref:Serine/threonine protein kinase n=1 Tax=Labilithrix luteola TaxID=1391654 RepID=A0A0K1QG24_9BACT|nr:serine/threonine-protein kinase [Labilithrix luteola]AKV04385.1 Serine/threonine protein kinase [Labilithrix luteola]
MFSPDLEFAKRHVGTTLCGRYHVDELLGVGGMAAVYRGRHRNGHRVAIKILHPAISLSGDLRERFLKEGYVANAVDHPGAVRVFDDDVGEQPFLVMELLEGETLHARWEKHGKKLPPDEVSAWACQLLAVLAAAHAKGIVHRDIKPENLFVTRSGELKVLDFGIARMRTAPGQLATVTGRVPGTPSFMAPEQALGIARDIDARTDLWAVGASMFSLLSGALVHEAETTEQMLVFAASRPARALRVVAPDAPSELAAIVDRALSFERDARWASADEMRGALESYRASAGFEIVPVVRQERPFPRLVTSPEAERPPLAEARGVASTNGGVVASKEHEPSPAAPGAGAKPRRARGSMVVAIGLVVLGGAAMLVPRWGAHRAAGTGSAEGLASASASMAAAEPATEPPPTVLPVATSSALSALSPSSPLAVASARAASSASPKPTSKTALPSSTGGATSHAPKTTPTAPPSVATADCDPPYYFDPVTSSRRVKPGC